MFPPFWVNAMPSLVAVVSADFLLYLLSNNSMALLYVVVGYSSLFVLKALSSSVLVQTQSNSHLLSFESMCISFCSSGVSLTLSSPFLCLIQYSQMDLNWSNCTPTDAAPSARVFNYSSHCELDISSLVCSCMANTSDRLLTRLSVSWWLSWWVNIVLEAFQFVDIFPLQFVVHLVL